MKYLLVYKSGPFLFRLNSVINECKDSFGRLYSFTEVQAQAFHYRSHGEMVYIKKSE
jgi:hypothetical protein